MVKPYLIQVAAFSTTSGGALKLNVTKQLANVIPRQPTVTPNSGSGVSQTFTFVFRDLDGVADMRQVNILINSSFNSANACYLVYDQYLGTISLLNDSASGVSKTRPGGPHNVENSQCILLARSSSVPSNATDLTLTLSLAFKQPFAGLRNIYPFTT